MRLGALRTAEMGAIFMIGDGMLGLMMPERHVALWRADVGILDRAVRPFAGRPVSRRLYGVLQMAAGFAIGASAAIVARRLHSWSTNPGAGSRLPAPGPSGPATI